MALALPIYRSCARQATLWCRSCGSSAGPRLHGLCRRCYTRDWRNRSAFAGLRPRVIARDGWACQVCGRRGAGKRLHVHHRRPGLSREHLLITLCAGCHARIHHTRCWRALPGLPAAALWREQHPGAPEQLALDFEGKSELVDPRAWLGEEQRAG